MSLPRNKGQTIAESRPKLSQRDAKKKLATLKTNMNDMAAKLESCFVHETTTLFSFLKE